MMVSNELELSSRNVYGITYKIHRVYFAVYCINTEYFSDDSKAIAAARDFSCSVQVIKLCTLVFIIILLATLLVNYFRASRKVRREGDVRCM